MDHLFSVDLLLNLLLELNIIDDIENLFHMFIIAYLSS